MKYCAVNIGDEIQSIAASRFLPHIDDYVFREQLDSFRIGSHEKFKTILNGWYMHHPKHFPPSEAIDPLLISMHFAQKIRSVLIGSKATVHYLREHGPVGCRDTDTARFLLENCIPAYHSGCMTLTLTENKALKASRTHEYILCVDVPDDITENVRSRTHKPVYSLTKIINPYVESLDRLELAKVYLYMYHNASAVITSNLHTALPCLAFNVPVCLIRYDYEDGRFQGLDNFLHQCKHSEFASYDYDVDNPPANRQDFTELRDSLAETCRNFTGYDSGRPTLEDDYRPDAMRMLQMMQGSSEGDRRAVWHIHGKSLLKVAAVKLWHKIFRPVAYDIVRYEYNYADKYLG